MSNYESISVKKALTNIATNKYLLPAIQRKFVWEIEQIEMLFDSIMRNYPINSFMLWQITDDEIKQNNKFYIFLKDFVQKFGEDNPDAPTQLLSNNFFAVIDGQQRLTSLYIGLIGSYKVKKQNKWWKLNEETTPMVKKELYLEITKQLSSNVDNEKIYNFKFLSDEEKQYDEENNPTHIWFKVGDVLKFNKLSDVNNYLIKNNLLENEFAMNTLTELNSKINNEEIINYYCVDVQDQDKVLDIFIRANSGGTPLSFSDLLMSIAAANWTELDAREEISLIKKEIYAYGNPNFNVSQDFILKSLLVLSDVDIAFKIKNFGRNNIAVFEKNWKRIKKSLVSTFNLLETLHFNDTLLRAKNAAIPIAYYIYKNNLEDEIIKSTYDKQDKENIARWLNMSILKGMFGGTSDSVLKNLRDAIKSSTSGKFPINEIFEKFKTNVDKNYNFDDDVIKTLLDEQWGTSACGVILNLLYPSVVLQYGKSVAEDHMHPRTFFESKNKLSALNLNNDQLEFYKNKNNYNSCLNLQLLERLENESKSDKSLIQWVNEKNKTSSDLLIEDNVSIDIKDFEKFIESRRKVLFNKLKEVLKI